MGIPDPEGEIPDGWPLERWEAYQLLKLDDTQTYASVGVAVGRRPSTISRWIRDWRAVYGPDVYVSPRAGKLNVTPEQAKEGSAIGGAVTAAKWADERVRFGTSLGITAGLANDVAAAGLVRLLEDPERLDGLAPKDLLDLGRLADLLAKRADAQISDPAGPFPGGPGGDAGFGVDLAGLESSGEHTQQVFEAASIVYRQYRIETGQEVVDVDEVQR